MGTVYDQQTPNAARLYDYYLGGSHNFDVDRAKAQELIDLWPNVVPVARFNRDFLRRVVLEAVDHGVDQFLDLGSGVPTVGNVHELAPEARVVYDDEEPVAHAAWRSLIDSADLGGRVAVVREDMRDPAAVLEAAETRRILDLSRPVCVLMIAVLHFVSPDSDPAGIIAGYRRRLAAGSWFALSHIASDEAPPEQKRDVERFVEAYRATSNPGYLRDRAEVTSWFDGFHLLEPGVTFLPDWRGDAEIEDPAHARRLAWCGVGEVPDSPN